MTTTKVKCSQHGFGIKNIRQAVERNQGMLEFFEQNNRFECDILLLNIQSRNE
ncbi:MAG: GHKL domain-containing protein [Butyricicoccaceae bacterium]